MSRLSLPLLRFKLRRVLLFALFAGAGGALYAILEVGLLGTDNFIYPSTRNPYSWPASFYSATIGGLLVGTILGLIEVSFFSRALNRYSLGFKLLIKTSFYFLLIFLVITCVSLANFQASTDLSWRSPEAFRSVIDFVSNLAFWSIMLYVISMISIFLLIAELAENLGQHVFWNYFTGKYHRPREEQRIFMFLDMNDSTTIAEELGHIRYFELVSEYYTEMTNPILESGGEIYQYVGDEIVISWPVGDPARNLRCLECFNGIVEVFEQRADYYREAYGFVPGFKAGIHAGEITTGEIGVLRKDILYTGDVLNTTSRIQGLCKSYEVALLISDELRELFGTNSGYQLEGVGTQQVRGRDEPVQLFALRS